jgi:hypothetical protein
MLDTINGIGSKGKLGYGVELEEQFLHAADRRQ